MRFKITSLRFILSSLLIRESIKLKPVALKDKVLAIHFWWVIAALAILSYYLMFNLFVHLEINLIGVPYLFTQNKDTRIDFTKSLICKESLVR